MEHKIIDNALNQKDFLNLKNILIGSDLEFPWYYVEGVSTDYTKNNCYYFVHIFYDSFKCFSNFFSLIKPIITIIDAKSLIKSKANLYPSRDKIETHGFHVDQPYSHKGAVFYVNTNDGYTELKDGTKVESIENRILLFDSSMEHQSTGCTNQHARITININYF